MASQKTWNYDEALANFNSNFNQPGLNSPEYVNWYNSTTMGQENPLTPGRVSGRTWNDILRDNAVQMYGQQAYSMTPEQLESIARNQGILGGKEQSYGEIAMEGLTGPLAIPAAFLTAGTLTGAFSGGAAGAGGMAGAEALGAMGTEAGLGFGGAASTLPGVASASGAGGLAQALGLTDGRTTAQIVGSALPGLLGAYGASQQANAYGNLANQYMGMGAPYRDRLAALYANPESFLTSKEVQIPVQQGTDALARALSIQGNPAQSGTALQELQNYSANQLFGRLGQEKDRLAGFGGLSAYNQAAPTAAGAEINANKGIYDAIGAGAADVLNPPKTLQQLLKELGGAAPRYGLA